MKHLALHEFVSFDATNGEYLAHAANAYPELVAALRECAEELSALRADGISAARVDRARALLARLDNA